MLEKKYYCKVCATIKYYLLTHKDEVEASVLESKTNTLKEYGAVCKKCGFDLSIEPKFIKK